MNTMQQEFDAVVAHLYKQGRPAKLRRHCLYRAEHEGEKLSCAVGCRIPDDKYSEAMDELPNTEVYYLVDKFSDVLPEEILAYTPMFWELQNAHDAPEHSVENGFNFLLLEASLRDIAYKFRLTFTKPQGDTNV